MSSWLRSCFNLNLNLKTDCPLWQCHFLWRSKIIKIYIYYLIILRIKLKFQEKSRNVGITVVSMKTATAAIRSEKLPCVDEWVKQPNQLCLQVFCDHVWTSCVLFIAQGRNHRYHFILYKASQLFQSLCFFLLTRNSFLHQSFGQTRIST